MIWQTLENALHAWVSTASGVPVVWAEQTGARPQTGAFATLKLSALTQVGAVDPVVTNYDAGRPAGEEIELQVQSLREFKLSVQFFSSFNTTDTSAFARADAAQRALYLPSVRETLAAAGLSAFDPGAIQTVTVLIGTRFESRALFEVRFYVMLTLSEFTTWIEHCTPVSYMGPPGLGNALLIDI